MASRSELYLFQGKKFKSHCQKEKIIPFKVFHETFSRNYEGKITLRLGGMDIGTNTVRVLIADIGEEGFREVKHERRITRLGEKVFETGNMVSGGMDRTLKAMKEFCDIAKKFSVHKIFAVGTNAFRIAKNKVFFIKKVFQETGLNIEVISGEEEAKRTLLGIIYGMAKKENEFLVSDIGGGSTEFIFYRENCLDQVLSVPLGVVSLTEKFLKTDPINPDDILSLQEEISEKLSIPILLDKKHQSLPLIGTAGTVTTLGAMAQGLKQFDRKKAHNYLLSRVAIENILQSLLNLSLSERLQLPGLEIGREDVIVSGILILLRVMKIFKAREVRVSDCGLLEGIVIHHATGIGLIKS